MTDEESFQAIVQKVIASGPHGPYAVSKCDQIGSVTFSLQPDVWKETEWPEPGNLVLLGKIRKKRAGWRAHFGRFHKPSDEQSAESSKQSSKEQGAS